MGNGHGQHPRVAEVWVLVRVFRNHGDDLVEGGVHPELPDRGRRRETDAGVFIREHGFEFHDGFRTGFACVFRRLGAKLGIGALGKVSE